MEQPVVIFDGVCELCNRSVNFVLRWERRPEIKFTANQNEPGRKLLDEFGVDPDEPGTVFFVENGKLYKESTAALRVSRHLKFPWNLAYGFIIIPPFIRNAVYRLIARNRYRWFGKKDTCRIPTPEEMARFLLE